jgi:hypothetical protein
MAEVTDVLFVLDCSAAPPQFNTNTSIDSILCVQCLESSPPSQNDARDPAHYPTISSLAAGQFRKVVL